MADDAAGAAGVVGELLECAGLEVDLFRGAGFPVFVGEGGCGAGVGEGEGGEQEREEVVEGHVLVIGVRGWGCKAGSAARSAQSGKG